MFPSPFSQSYVQLPGSRRLLGADVAQKSLSSSLSVPGCAPQFLRIKHCGIPVCSLSEAGAAITSPPWPVH
eukprot:260338-Rhodomonas_salina.1